MLGFDWNKISLDLLIMLSIEKSRLVCVLRDFLLTPELKDVSKEDKLEIFKEALEVADEKVATKKELDYIFSGFKSIKHDLISTRGVSEDELDQEFTQLGDI
jgi:hypothetical protein